VGYTTNLTAAFNQSVLGFGVAPVLRGDNDTNALYLITNAMLTIGRGWAATGTLSHRRQHYQQSDFSDTQYNGSVNYHFSSRFLGFMYFSFGMVDQANKAGNAGTGLTGNIGMAKKFGKWNSSADFNYSQAVQTLYSIATTSNYSYGGTVQRKLSPYTHWGASYRSSHSALTMAAGTGSGSESMSTNLSWKRYVFSGNYSQSNGTAIINSQGGLTPTPVGSIISPDFLYFNARSYGFNANGRFFQRLTVSGGYTMVSSGTQQPVLNTASSGSRYYVRTQYRLRHFSIDGGYDRATQEVSTLAGPPRVVNSFQLGIARWFNLF
jgi:hypothetical protein